MDTTAARGEMREFGLQGQEVLKGFLAADISRGAAVNECRRLEVSSRAVLADAGYPGEAIWQCLRRSVSALETNIDVADIGYWGDLIQGLEDATDVLDSLLASPAGRDLDFRIIG